MLYYSSTKSENKPVGIPILYYYGPVGKYDALVIEFLGPTLDDLFEKHNQHFSLKTVCQIAIQLMNRIQYIHSRGIIYRDIKVSATESTDCLLIAAFVLFVLFCSRRICC